MTQAKEISRCIVKTSEIIGQDVNSLSGENLGTIKEIILDKVKGNVRYVVLSFGGFLGLGNKLFALPWNKLSYSEEEDGFIINVSEEKLKNAPGFDKSKWPDFSDTVWGESIDSYYDLENELEQVL